MISDTYHILKNRISNNNSINIARKTAVTITKPRTFSFIGKEFDYNNHLYNHSWSNERCVEVPIIEEYVRKCPGRVLEIGNVLSHYFPVKHDVVDKYERAKHVINDDVCDFRTGGRYDLIVSISTIEHIGQDEDVKEPGKPLRAIENLRSLLRYGGRIVATIPLGYNKNLDNMIRNGQIPFSQISCLKRVSFLNEWEEVPYSDVMNLRYGTPYNNANGVIIMTILPIPVDTGTKEGN